MLPVGEMIRARSLRRAARSVARDPVARGWAARGLTLPGTAAAAFGATAVVVSAVGASSYGYVALIATLTALVPFADLGIGSTVQTAAAIADDPATDVELESHLLSAIRLLTASGTVVVALASGLGAAGSWSYLLHVPATASINANVAVPMVLAMFALSLPFGIGQRILLGRGRTELTVLVSASASVSTLIIACGLWIIGAPAVAYAGAPAAAALLSAVAGLLIACRVTGIDWRAIGLRAFRPRAYAGRPLIASAAPMLVVMVGLPIALQSDRIVLAHRASSPATALAQYALAAQVYATVWGVVYSGGVALWSKFARERSQGDDLRASWRRALAAFALAGIAFGGVTGVALPSIVHLVSGGSIRASPLLSWAFAALIAIHTAHLPSAMLLTSRAMLWFQASCVLLMLAVNLPLSWWMARPLGAPGPVIASVVAVSFVQLGTGWFAARRFTMPDATTRGVALGVCP